MREKTNIIEVMTPEGVSFAFQLAGPVSRFAAWLVDFMIILLALMAFNNTIAFLQLVDPGMMNALIYLFAFIFPIAYGIFFEWYWRGRTVGKKLLRLRVMDEQGLRLQLSQIVIRNLLRFVDCQPLMFYGLGGLACLFSRRSQRLGDIAANTIVIRNPKISQPDLEQIMGGKFNSFRTQPHLEARLRQNIAPREAGIALQALLRRDSLEPEARIELFGQIADHFREIVAFPAEVTDGLSDEQYVRNTVDAVFR